MLFRSFDLIAYGDKDSPQYALVLSDAQQSPLLQGQGLTFLKSRGGEVSEDTNGRAFGTASRLILPILFPRGLSDAEIKAETRDVPVTSLFTPLPTKMRCEVTVENMEDGLHVVRTKVDDSDKPDETKTKQVGQPAIRKWRDEYVLAKDSGQLIKGHTHYEADYNAGQQTQKLVIDLTAKMGNRVEIGRASCRERV